MDNIARQARQGSVAAIIQVLNEKLADSGLRTRAIFADGVLQLLCEAATAEQLEQTVVVPQIRQILEALAPRNIRRVCINSRIVREQQLLWLEEISRDPENQLLWSEAIILTKPNIFKRLAEDLKEPKPTRSKDPAFPRSSAQFKQEKQQFWRGIVGGASLSLLLLLVGWAVYDWLSPKLRGQIPAQNPSSAPQSSSNPKTGTSPASGPFADAVRMAEKASALSKIAQSQAQWLDLATKWQQASDLMGAVPPSDPRYQTAQNRMVLYRQNREAALIEAQKRQSGN